jgi:hypothetical protein
MTKAKAQPLLKKTKTNRDIIWNEKGELKYKDKTVQGSNMVDLVNDVLRKRKYYCFWYAVQDFAFDGIGRF